MNLYFSEKYPQLFQFFANYFGEDARDDFPDALSSVLAFIDTALPKEFTTTVEELTSFLHETESTSDK